MSSTHSRDPVGRALDLLTWLADHGSDGPLGVREIARRTGTSPTTVHRLLQAFEERSLVRRDGAGSYFGGLELLRLGTLAARFSVPDAARPALERLVAETDEVAMLGLYHPECAELMVVDCVQTTQALRYAVQPGTWRELWRDAAGLGVLAFLPAEERTQVLLRHPPRADATDVVITADAVEQQCADARDRGYAYTRGQHTIGAVGLAAPVRDADARVVGDVCLTVPENRFREEDKQRIAAAVIAAADAVTDTVSAAGYRLAGAGVDPVLPPARSVGATVQPLPRATWAGRGRRPRG